MILYLLTCLIFGSYFGVSVASNPNHTMSIEIVRTRSPTENLLNYGTHLDEISKGFMKHHGKGGNRTNDSIALFRYLDDEFYGIVNVGHPAQIMNVAFDTTWGVSWVLSSKCSSVKAIGCWLHNKYDHSKSSSYKKDGRVFSLNLGNFNMTGIFSYDNISIAHSNVTTQSFVEMITVPNDFITNKADGVLGLGLKANDSDEYSPFFYTLIQQKKIKNPIFSIYLNRDRQSNRGGNIMLGFVDEKHIHHTRVRNQSIPDNFTYLDIDKGVSYWRFKMDRIVVNPLKKDDDTIIVCQNGCSATVDTSANSIVGPKADVDAIHDAIHASEFLLNRYTVDCDTINKMQKIDIVLDGKNFTLKGEDYTVKMSYHSITICLSAFVPATTPEEQNFWLLGGAFLSAYYSVYNINDRTIGFVKAN